MLCAYLLIEPFGQQPTVTHALNSYLDLIASVKDSKKTEIANANVAPSS